jgi:hypothetical protein
MVMAAAEVNPAITGREMKSMRKPAISRDIRRQFFEAMRRPAISKYNGNWFLESILNFISQI